MDGRGQGHASIFGAHRDVTIVGNDDINVIIIITDLVGHSVQVILQCMGLQVSIVSCSRNATILNTMISIRRIILPILAKCCRATTGSEHVESQGSMRATAKTMESQTRVTRKREGINVGTMSTGSLTVENDALRYLYPLLLLPISTRGATG